jgi:hypothetical protein
MAEFRANHVFSIMRALMTLLLGLQVASVQIKPLRERSSLLQHSLEQEMIAVDANKSTVLRPVVDALQAAIVYTDSGDKVQSLRKTAFINFLDVYAVTLDKLGGNLGTYLRTNVDKLRRSKASTTEEDYKAWLLSELPTHKATRFRSYVDDSAWMGNLWISWTLEFFNEFFALLQEGNDPRAGMETAYSTTLRNHHTLIQRGLMHQAMKRLTSKEQVFGALRGTADDEQVKRDLGALATIGRLVASYCMEMDNIVVARMSEERAKR